MPTFRQIGIPRETRDKLAGIKRPRPDDETSSSRASNSQEDNISNFAPIKTPSALLSRNPHQLCSLLEVSIESLKTIRAGVADALIADETTGHSGCAEVIRWAERGLDPSYIASRHTDENNNNNNDEGGCDGLFDSTFRPPQLIVGSISALELCAHSLQLDNTQHVSTGCAGLDSLLGSQINLNMKLGYPFDISTQNHVDADRINSKGNGGVPFGFITEVSGPPSCGKTQFCLSIMSNARQTKVIYITSGNVQSISRRLLSLCVECSRRHEDDTDGFEECKQNAEKQMEGFSIVSVSDGYKLLALLAKIEQQELSHNSNNAEQSTLLVIDSISAIIGHHLSNLTAGSALVNQIGRTLRQMTRALDGRIVTNDINDQFIRRFGIVIANGSVSNWSDGFEKNNSKPAMGRYWHVSDIGLWMEEEPQEARLELQDFHQDGLIGLHRGHKKVVRATLMNHWAKKSGGSVMFVVRSGGVYDV